MSTSIILVALKGRANDFEILLFVPFFLFKEPLRTLGGCNTVQIPILNLTVTSANQTQIVRSHID